MPGWLPEEVGCPVRERGYALACWVLLFRFAFCQPRFRPRDLFRLLLDFDLFLVEEL
jgi:hypothetical protein